MLPVTTGHPRCERGQATILVLGLLIVVLPGAFVLGEVARGLGLQGDQQGAADLAALAGARAMHRAYGGLFEPAAVAGRPNPAHVERDDYLRRGREAAQVTARRNGARRVEVAFPDRETLAPVRIRVTVRDPVSVGDARLAAGARAEAELAPPQTLSLDGPPRAGEYPGPFATRDGKPMRPDVAAGFDRLAAAARRAGHRLIVTSAFRSNAEQAALYVRRPDPKWVARPGSSLHRLGTELDLGPPSAYGWLAANARRYHFVKRYSWEPWHFGYTLNAGTRSVGYGRGGRATGSAIPAYVPARFRDPLRSASASRRPCWPPRSRPRATSTPTRARRPASAGSPSSCRPPRGATGWATPSTPRRRSAPRRASCATCLCRFGSVPLALAAYNAGPAPVQRCGCIPPYPETRGYVARILGLLVGAGVVAADRRPRGSPGAVRSPALRRSPRDSRAGPRILVGRAVDPLAGVGERDRLLGRGDPLVQGLDQLAQRLLVALHHQHRGRGLVEHGGLGKRADALDVGGGLGAAAAVAQDEGALGQRTDPSPAARGARGPP